MPKVSVIVPNYNHAPFLEQRLESVLGQTVGDYELILLDDCSTDGSRDIISRYKNRCPDARVFLNERNSGSPFKQWDFGVRQARGEYVWIAESDDYAQEDFLEEMVPLLDRNEKVGLAYCDSLIVDERGRPRGLVSENCRAYGERSPSDYVSKGTEEVGTYLWLRNTINNVSGVLFRKRSYVECGFAECSMRYCGDWFLYLRMLSIADIAYRAKALNVMRLHGRSSFHEYYASEVYMREVIRVYEYVIGSVPLVQEQRQKIYDQLSMCCLAGLSRGVIPSREVLAKLRGVVPFFEVNTLRWVAGYILRRCGLGLRAIGRVIGCF